MYHAAALLLGRQVYVLLIGKKVQVGMSVTVSAKVKKELWKKAKEYGINISEVIREALEGGLRKRRRNGLSGLWRSYPAKQFWKKNPLRLFEGKEIANDCDSSGCQCCRQVIH